MLSASSLWYCYHKYDNNTGRSFVSIWVGKFQKPFLTDRANFKMQNSFLDCVYVFELLDNLNYFLFCYLKSKEILLFACIKR